MYKLEIKIFINIFRRSFVRFVQIFFTLFFISIFDWNSFVLWRSSKWKDAEQNLWDIRWINNSINNSINNRLLSRSSDVPSFRQPRPLGVIETWWVIAQPLSNWALSPSFLLSAIRIAYFIHSLDPSPFIFNKMSAWKYDGSRIDIESSKLKREIFIHVCTCYITYFFHFAKYMSLYCTDIKI